MTTGHDLLSLHQLSVEFLTDKGKVRAVDGVSFSVKKGQTVGVVGESGCGKSVTALSLMRLIPCPPGSYPEGQIFFEGRDILTLPEKEMRLLRGNRISMIFQEPMTSLNPVFTIGDQIAESLVLHQRLSKKEAFHRAVEMLQKVGIPAPQERAYNYPHQLSGGMRQRVMIAMALCCQPSLLIADEPTTALDVTIQAQMLELIKGLQKEIQMSVILITHDLAVVAETCDEVIVMYAGRVVEKVKTRTVFARPAHPYTVGLLNSVPGAHQGKAHRLNTIPGIVPNLLHLPKGCRFQDRCAFATEQCKALEPELTEIAPEHFVRCFYPLNQEKVSL